MPSWGALSIVSTRVDAESTVLEQLMEDLVARDQFLIDNLLFLDGTIPMTGSLDMDGNDIQNIGDIAADTGTITTLGATTGNITTVNATTVNATTLTGPALQAGAVGKISEGTATTSISSELHDSASDIDFTEGITAGNFIVYLPAVASYLLAVVQAVISATQLDLSDTTKDGKEGFSITSGDAYRIYKIPPTDRFTQIYSINIASGDETTHNYAFKSTHGGLNRRIARVVSDRAHINDTITITYGGETLVNDTTANHDPAGMFLMAKTGTNNVGIKKTGTNAAADVTIEVEDVLEPEAYIA